MMFLHPMLMSCLFFLLKNIRRKFEKSISLCRWFLLDTTIANKISSMDCYNISLIPTILTDGDVEIKYYYYLKIFSVKSCINVSESEYYKSGDVISYNKIPILSSEISVKDRIFFIDDEYSILMDEQLMSTFEESDIVFQEVNIT